MSGYLKFFSILFIMCFCINTAQPIEFDTSIDAEIREKYNSNKLNEEILPSLPATVSTPSKSSIPSSKNTSVPSVTPKYNQTDSVVSKIEHKSSVKIPVWTKFKVKSNTKVNNWLAKGSSVNFVSTSPVYKKYVTIPSGTVFTGYVSDIHQPQLSGNGALVELKINSMRLNGKNISINAKVTKANGKKIFFNSIKGDRKYIESVGKQVDKGENFYKKSRQISSKLASNPVGIVFSPIPTVAGWVGYALCTVASPITGLGAKGGNVSIPSGSAFEIKLLESVYLE